HSGDPLHPSHPQGRRMVGFCLGGTHRPNADHVGKPHPGCVTGMYSNQLNYQTFSKFVQFISSLRLQRYYFFYYLQIFRAFF
ncbi:MAG: hypothetical protein ACFNVN_08065, partial [Capnocytophaga ochracea]